MLGACKAPRRTMSEIAQGSLIPTDCALFVAVVQRCTRKKRNLTVDSSRQLASFSCHNYLSLSTVTAPLLDSVSQLCSSQRRTKHHGRFHFFFLLFLFSSFSSRTRPVTSPSSRFGDVPDGEAYNWPAFFCSGHWSVS